MHDSLGSHHSEAVPGVLFSRGMPLGLLGAGVVSKIESDGSA